MTWYLPWTWFSDHKATPVSPITYPRPYIPQPYSMSEINTDLLALTGTLYGEVRGQTQQQRENVARVILNRVKFGWQPSVLDVCLAPYQFSCWLASDPNQMKILRAVVEDPLVWDECKQIAQDALTGSISDVVQNATSYYATGSKAPYWIKPPAKHICDDGAHSFYYLAR